MQKVTTRLVLALPIAGFFAALSGAGYSDSRDIIVPSTSGAGSGDVSGPGAAVTDRSIAVWNGTGGATIAGTAPTISAAGVMTVGTSTFQADVTNTNVQIGTSGAGAVGFKLLVSKAAADTSGATGLLRLTGKNDTGITASTEQNEILATPGSKTWADGTVANERIYRFGQGTLNGTTTLATFTRSSLFNIGGAPICGTLAACTTTVAFDIQSVNSTNGGVAPGTAIGLAVAVPTGATTNVAAQFDNMRLTTNTISTTSGALNLTPVAGQAVSIDGTTFDGGVIAGTGITAIDNTTESTIEAALDTAANLTSIGGWTVQNVSTAGTPTFAQLTVTGTSIINPNAVSAGSTVGALEVRRNSGGASYIASFYNDGDNANRYGINIQAGADDASGTTYYLEAMDGNGDVVGLIQNASGTFSLVDSSDARLKTHIAPTKVNAIDVIMSIETAEFAESKTATVADVPIGFIAQNVQDAAPWAVTTMPSGFLGVAKEALIPVLVKGAQQQQNKIDGLEIIIAEQSAILANLSERVAILESLSQ